MGERGERRTFAAEREVDRAEVRDHGNAGSRGNDGGLAQLQRRGELSASRAAWRQMKKSMAMRSDEGDVGEQDFRAAGDLDRGTSKVPAAREVERGNRSSADF